MGEDIERVPDDAKDFKFPDSVVVADTSSADIISDSEIEEMINKRRASKVTETEKELTEIKEKIKDLAQRSWLTKTFSERAEIEKQVRKLSDEESEISMKLTEAKQEMGRQIRPEEIENIKSEFEKTESKKEAVKGEPREEKADDFITEIRNNDRLTLKEKGKIIKEKLEGIQTKKGLQGITSDQDFQTLRLFYVEILDEQKRIQEAEEAKKPKEAPVKTEKPLETKVEVAKKEPEGKRIEPESVIIKTDEAGGKEEIKESPKVMESKEEKQAPKPREEKKLTPEEIKVKMEEAKAKRERLEKERKEQERKRKELLEFAKNNEEEFKKIWFNLREKSNKLTNIRTILKNEEEKINKILSNKKQEFLKADLKLNFLRDKNLMNEEKKNISYILDEELSEENVEIIKNILGELSGKYKERIAMTERIDKDSNKIAGHMNNVFMESKDKSIFDAVPDQNKETEAISGEEFEKLDETIKNIEKQIKTEIAKLSLTETKQEEK